MLGSDLTWAVFLLLGGVAIIALSGTATRGWGKSSPSAPGDLTPSIWRIRWQDIPESRLRWGHRAFGTLVLAGGLYELVAWLIAR